MIFLAILLWCICKASSDADDYFEELERRKYLDDRARENKGEI